MPDPTTPLDRAFLDRVAAHAFDENPPPPSPLAIAGANAQAREASGRRGRRGTFDAPLSVSPTNCLRYLPGLCPRYGASHGTAHEMRLGRRRTTKGIRNARLLHELLETAAGFGQKSRLKSR